MTDHEQLSPLYEALDIASLPAEEQVELLADIGDLVREATLIRILEQMDDATADAFGALFAGDPTDEQVAAFIAEHVPNAEVLAQEAIQELANDILTNTDTN